MKTETISFMDRELRVSCYPSMLLLSLLWTLYYTPGSGTTAYLSFILQQTAIFSLLQVIDTFAPDRRLKYTAAGSAMLYVFMIHINAFLLSITSMSLYESIIVLSTGGDFLYSLEEAGLSTGFITLVVLLLASVFAAGCAAWRFMPHVTTRRRGIVLLPVFLFIASSSAFTAEQVMNRDRPGFFWRRALPLYLELYSTGRNTMTFMADGAARLSAESYSGISKAANPQNLIFILLESFRADSINSELAPELKRLAGDSYASDGYYTGAIYTSLAWNSLLMDRPVYTITSDIAYDMEKNPGSGILRIFRNAGYETYVASSANLEWKGFRERIDGRDRLIDHYFCGYTPDTVERNIIDNRTTAAADEWIMNSRRDRPFAMIIQLDSTHWTYFSDPENLKSRPFAGRDVNIAKLRKPGDLELLLNRYKNAVRQVNAEVSRITGALKKKGIYDSTAIVIVSDHGEGFSPGMIGHHVLHDDIKKPAFIMRLPGAGRYRSSEYITDAEIFPTLFDYLGINGWSGLMRGRSILDPEYRRECVLTFHGSLLSADLTFSDYRVLFRVNHSCGRVSFTPVYFTDNAGKIIPDPGRGQWREALSSMMKQ